MCQDYAGGPGGSTTSTTLTGCLECTARGDRTAFADLYDDTVGAVHRLALLRCRGDERAAADAVRRTYVAVWERSSTFRPDEHRPRTWVLAVAQSLGRAV